MSEYVPLDYYYTLLVDLLEFMQLRPKNVKLRLTTHLQILH